MAVDNRYIIKSLLNEFASKELDVENEWDWLGFVRIEELSKEAYFQQRMKANNCAK